MGEQQKVNQADTDLNHALKARRDKLAELQTTGKDPFQITKYDVTTHSMDTKGSHEQWEGEEAAVAKRMMFKRVMSKTSFCNVQDLKGSIQVYTAKGGVGEKSYKDFKKIGIGDIVGAKGTALTTKTGEISTHAMEMTPPSKSLQVLPEKFRGLTDTDMRRRRRYVGLIMNAEVRDIFIEHSRILAVICKYLGGEGFMEAETPMLIPNASGAAAKPSKTHFNTLNEDLKLRILLELYLKRFIVDGLERVYEIGRILRSEDLDIRHNPEFTLMELYQVYTDYNGMMNLTEKLYRFVTQEVPGTTTITYKSVEMDLGKLFVRITMVDAVEKYAGIDLDQTHTLEEARTVAREKGVEFEGRHKKGDILNLFFKEFAEEHLAQPASVLDHPVEISPLAKKKPGNPDYVGCLESFTNGWKMTSAYSEINDPISQRRRFRAQGESLIQDDEEVNRTDEDFLNMPEMGMSPARGIGFGINRTVTLLTDSSVIRGVLLFLAMKSLSDSGDSEKADVASAWAAAEAGDTVGKVQVIQGKIDLSKVKTEPLFREVVGFGTFVRSDYRIMKIKDCVVIPKSKKLLQFTLDNGDGTDCTILGGICEYYRSEKLIGETAIAIASLLPRKMIGIDFCGTLIPAVHEGDGKEGLNLLMVDGWIPTGAKLY